MPKVKVDHVKQLSDNLELANEKIFDAQGAVQWVINQVNNNPSCSHILNFTNVESDLSSMIAQLIALQNDLSRQMTIIDTA